MEVKFRGSFLRDIKRIRNENILKRIGEKIKEIEKSNDLYSITGLKKLLIGDFYRLRIGDYRIGLEYEKGIVSFVRFLHRREIYRYFP